MKSGYFIIFRYWCSPRIAVPLQKICEDRLHLSNQSELYCIRFALSLHPKKETNLNNMNNIVHEFKLIIMTAAMLLPMSVTAQVNAADSVMQHVKGNRLSVGGYGEVAYSRNFFSDPCRQVAPRSCSGVL